MTNYAQNVIPSAWQHEVDTYSETAMKPLFFTQ